jgi:hypothetical protein
VWRVACGVADAEGEDMLWAQKESWCAGLFGGDFTEGFVTMSLQHITRSRFQISRDLFFLLSFVMRLENTVPPPPRAASLVAQRQFVPTHACVVCMRQVELPAKAFAEIESELLPRVATLVKSYHLLHWTTVQYCPTFEKYAHPPLPRHTHTYTHNTNQTTLMPDIRISCAICCG